MTQLKFNGQHVFRVGQTLTLETKPTKPTKEEQEVTNAEKQVMNALAKGILARAKDESGVRVTVGPAPPVILAKTEAQERVDEHYAKTETIRQNVNGVQGLESYAPPPCILAPLEKE